MTLIKTYTTQWINNKMMIVYTPNKSERASKSATVEKTFKYVIEGTSVETLQV